MKIFLVENSRKGSKIKVTLHNPPYENENILHRTNWKEKDCVITEVFSGWDGDMNNPSLMDKDIIGDDCDE